MDRGGFVETLETATSWTNLPVLYAAVQQALRSTLSERGTPPLVMCHVSHLYRSGASLYFTFLARQEPGAELDQWRAAKTAACDAIVANGGTITHHHAIGRDHAPWLAAEVREAARLRAEAMDVSDRWVEAGSDPANPMLAQERALLVRSYAALLAAVHR